MSYSGYVNKNKTAQIRKMLRSIPHRAEHAKIVINPGSMGNFCFKDAILRTVSLWSYASKSNIAMVVD